ncbi:MAG: cyclic nucleotide-binding domain-containing protein [Pseudomonadota bacterium]
MLQRFFKVRKGEGRIVLLLGSFFFLMLAGTTIIGIASDSLFLSQLGASKLPYGILFGQVLIIPIFAIYGRAKGLIKPRWTNPIVVLPLLVLLATLYFFFDVNPTWSAGLFLVLVPCIAGLLGSENGRLSATLLDPRSARRLSPLISTIGGLGASFGASIGEFASRHLEVPTLILFAMVFVALVMVPAWFVDGSARPRGGAKSKVSPAIFKHRYALMLVLSAGIVAAIATVLRTQLGAVAAESYNQSELSEFFSRLALVINLVSIFFTLFLSRALVAKLGAANSLLLYPSALMLIGFAGALAPSLMIVTSAVFVDRLVRQNVHGIVSTLAIMPLNSQIRLRAAMLIRGSARPLGVVLSSLLMIIILENVIGLPMPLDWTHLSWIVVVLAGLILGALAFVRGRYVIELVAALHARRLRLESGDDDVIPMDGELKGMLLGYLRSDLPERCSLALQLLSDYVDDDVVETIEACWPNWEPWLRADAIKVLANEPSDNAKVFIQSLSDGESDEVQATAFKVFADSFEEDQLRQKVTDAPVNTRSEAIATLGNRFGDDSIKELVEGLSQSENDADRKTSALTISKLVSNHFDPLIPKLLRDAPIALMGVMANRPDPAYADLVTPWLARDRVFVQARRVLRALGDESIEALKSGAKQAATSVAALELLAELDTPKARQALFEFVKDDNRDTSFRALVALSHEDSVLSAQEQANVNQFLDRSLNDMVRHHGFANANSGAAEEMAASELRYSLECVFVALQLLNTNVAYRQLFLSLYSHDARQRALAAEALDEVLPATIKTQVLPIIEGEPPSGKVPEVDPQWQQVVKSLERSEETSDLVADLTRSGLFSGWRYSELNALKSQPDTEEPAVIIRAGEAIDPETVILTGKTPAVQNDDVVLPLKDIYRVIARNPRCGSLWLKGLADRIPETSDGGGEVTRTEMLSLATKTLANDQDSAGDLDLWQRVFFLRTMQLTQSLPSHRLRLVAEISRTLSAQAGETVCNEGRLGNHFYMVCTGRLQVLAKGQVITHLGPSDAFGALALMRGERRTFTVVAEEPSELLTIDRVDFNDLIDAHPSLVRSFARMLANLIQATRQPQDKTA